MKKIPNQNENQKLEELFLAIYFNDVQKVEEFKNTYPKIYAKKTHFLLDKNTVFDMANLTVFNQILWFSDDWLEDAQPFIDNMRHKTNQMIQFWKNETGDFSLDKNFRYNQYHEFFYCANPDEDDGFIEEPTSFFIEKGFREIDVELYKKVASFDFDNVEKLLKRGAKPNINLYEEDYSDILSQIELEISFLETGSVVPEFEVFEQEAYNQEFNISYMFADLLGVAAYEKMYALLKSYH